MEIITEKYIQINRIIKEIEQMLIKTHILEWNSIDFDNYSDYVYKNPNNFFFIDAINSQRDYLNICERVMKFLSDNRDPEIFESIWSVNDKYKFQLSPIASKEHLSELFDEYIFILTSIQEMLIGCYTKYTYFSPYIRDNISDCISTLERYIKPMRFIVKDLYINHPNYNYKFEAKYYLDKINELINQNIHSDYVWEVIDGHLKDMDKCLSGEEIIIHLQICHDKIYNYYNGDRIISSKNEELSAKYRPRHKTKEIHEYIDEAYITIEKDREYMTKSWRKINMLITKLFYELEFNSDVNAIKTRHWKLIGQHLKIIYDVVNNDDDDPVDPVVILPIIEEQQKNIMEVLGNYSFQYWYDDPHGIDYESYPYLKKKYILPIESIVKYQVSHEYFH